MKQIELLIKPVSYDCNLDCKYCFYKKTFSLYSGKNHRMRKDVVKKLISESMRYSDGGPCIFSWQGGEPLLTGVDFFKRVIELEKKYGRPGQRVSNSIQTNGTLLNSEWIKLLREYNFLVGVSLDGPSKVHNHYRYYPSGSGSFEKVMEKIHLLKKGRVEFNILSTIGRQTAKYPERIYNFSLSQGFSYLQFIPAVDRRKGKIEEFSITPTQYGDFLCKLFDLWWNGVNPPASIRMFDNILEILLQGNSSSCMFKSSCGEYIVVEFNGDVYPCDFFVRKEWRLGNIFEMPIEQLFKRAKSHFGESRKIAPSDCDRCPWNFICHNGCPWFRWVKNGNIKDKDYFCQAYKQFFSHTIEKFKKLRDSILLKNVGRNFRKNF